MLKKLHNHTASFPEVSAISGLTSPVKLIWRIHFGSSTHLKTMNWPGDKADKHIATAHSSTLSTFFLWNNPFVLM